MSENIHILFPFRAMTKDNNKSRNPRTLRYYLTKEFKEFEMLVRDCAIKQYKGKPLEGPLVVHLHFTFKNHVHPDMWNLPKSICDALTGVLWKNDKQAIRGFLSLDVNKDEEDSFYIVVKRFKIDGVIQ